MSLADSVQATLSGETAVATRPRCIPCFLLRVTVSIGLLAAALWLSSAEVAWHELAGLPLATLASCVLLSLAIVPLLGWRWFLIARRMAPGRPLPSLWSFSRLVWAGLATNQILPSFVGGDAVRLALLSRRGVPAQLAAGSVVVDRISGFAGLLALGAGAALALGGAFADPVRHAAILFGGCALAAVGGLLAAAHFSQRIARMATLLKSAASPSTLLVTTLLSAAGHLANIAVFLVLASALGLSLPVLPTICVLSTVLLATALPVSINGWGIRELTLVQAFGYIDVASDRILLVSVAYGLLHLAVQSCGFLFASGRHRP